MLAKIGEIVHDPNFYWGVGSCIVVIVVIYIVLILLALSQGDVP